MIRILKNGGGEWEGISVSNVDDLSVNYPNAVWIVSSSEVGEIQDVLKKKHSDLDIFDRSEFLRLMEMQLAFIIYDAPIDKVSYAGYWFGLYEQLDEKSKLNRYLEEIYGLMEDDISRDILEKRIKFFRTGDVKYIKEIPKSYPIYFSDEYYPIRRTEVLFDCGAYNGDTIEEFMKMEMIDQKKVIAFEPDPSNVEKIHRMIIEQDYSGIEVHSCATGKKEGMNKFSGNGTDGGKIDDTGQNSVKVVRLDGYIEMEPTWIKMDIEGSELDSLIGAEKILKSLKPKVAVSIYHKYMDFYEIPRYLHELVPEYKFRIRHHTDGLYDTVLYAWV